MRRELPGLFIACLIAAAALVYMAALVGPQMSDCLSKRGVLVRALTPTGYTCIAALPVETF